MISTRATRRARLLKEHEGRHPQERRHGRDDGATEDRGDLFAKRHQNGKPEEAGEAHGKAPNLHSRRLHHSTFQGGQESAQSEAPNVFTEHAATTAHTHGSTVPPTVIVLAPLQAVPTRPHPTVATVQHAARHAIPCGVAAVMAASLVRTAAESSMTGALDNSDEAAASARIIALNVPMIALPWT